MNPEVYWRVSLGLFKDIFLPNRIRVIGVVRL